MALLSGAGAAPGPQPAAPAPGGFVLVDYGDLLDLRRPTHSGEPVATVLEDLGGRAVPPPGERPADALAHSLLDPIVEPYAFVLADALDTIAAVPERLRFEVGGLWQPGEPQPAWAELLRARSLLVESDGAGRLRVLVPWRGAPGEAVPESDPAGAASRAYDRAWGVLRLVFAAEMRRLAARAGDGSQDHPLEVEVHAFVHEPALHRFRLGVQAFRARVTDTRPRGDRPPLDLDGMRSFLDHGLLLEGGRLEERGELRLIGSEPNEKPALLGRPIALADWAAAYRAVFHGGLAEPYMSLDRGISPQTSLVNYGGRLRDTSLGLVSLLCDIRFKTFSLGLDIVSDRDDRERLRRGMPEFRTHLERLAEDPRSQGITGQQTRLWFYPDDVDLTLSEQGDVLVMRRARMTASAERVTQATGGARPADPPWTVDTVAAVNRDYGPLGGFYPELRDLDQVARVLSLFAWLRMAAEDGQIVPELDSLLSVELPGLSTPRTFPQLLAFNALPPSQGKGAVDVVSQVPVGQALDRLQPADGGTLSAARRLSRALAALDRSLADHAKLATEIEAMDRGRMGDAALDLLAYRAERLRMHHLVLSTLGAPDRLRLSQREKGLRVFSVGIGGLDLNMTKRLARASHRSERLSWGSAGRPSAQRTVADAARAPGEGETGAPAEPRANPVDAWRKDPAEVGAVVLPDHGGSILVESGSATLGGSKVAWVRTVNGADGPEPSSRTLALDAARRVRLVERFEDGRFLRFRLERDGDLYRAKAVFDGLTPAEPRRREPAAPTGALAVLDLPPPEPAAGGVAEPDLVRLRVRGGSREDRTATLPRRELQRLVLGRRVDPTPDAPLTGLASPAELLGSAAALMVLAGDARGSPPWARPVTPIPGRRTRSGSPARWETGGAGGRRAARWWWAPTPPSPRDVGTASPGSAPTPCCSSQRTPFRGRARRDEQRSRRRGSDPSWIGTRLPRGRRSWFSSAPSRPRCWGSA